MSEPLTDDVEPREDEVESDFTTLVEALLAQVADDPQEATPGDS